ncbi:hypothetical protein GTW46_10725 [Streptomyces sp. SID6013]|nr:hypothetical protein [Streptomyces sp. SID6013]
MTGGQREHDGQVAPRRSGVEYGPEGTGPTALRRQGVGVLLPQRGAPVVEHARGVA